MFKHVGRDCIYDEAMICAKMKLDDPETIIEQAKYYEDHEFPKHKGLWECGFMIRRNNERTRRFNEAWWADYCRFSRRDQISSMPAMDLAGIIVNTIPGEYKLEDDGSYTKGDIIQIFEHKNTSGNWNDPKNLTI
jgi:hypothetical protein